MPYLTGGAIHKRTVIILIDFLSEVILWLFSGFYCPMGSAFPQPCKAGFYCNQTGLHAPAGLCAAGYYCSQGSSDPNATPCPAGHYCPDGALFPWPCPLGTMKSEILLIHLHIHSWDISQVEVELVIAGMQTYYPPFALGWINEKGVISMCCWTQTTPTFSLFLHTALIFFHELVSFFEIQWWMKIWNSVIEAFIFPLV